MAPHRDPPRKPHHRHVPSSAVASFIDQERLEALIAPLVEDPAAREFLVRCLVREGPAHHRGSNYVLVSLLARVLERLPAVKPAEGAPSVPVPLRLPPHLEDQVEDAEYPLRLPRAPLEALVPAGSRDFEAAVDCLTDGPPQHVVANVLMVALLDRILAALPEGPR